MFRKLNRIFNQKGQNTAEYALLISLVVAAIIAMQTYAQRALQARIRDASIYMRDGTNPLGNTLQYEPYYLSTNYEITRDSKENTRLGNQLEVWRHVEHHITLQLISHGRRSLYQLDRFDEVT